MSKITPWSPEQDPLRLAILGKLAEEASELAARASRCIIHGLDQVDPDTGRLNSEELQREAADVTACLLVIERSLQLQPMRARQQEKLNGYALWHQMINKMRGKANG